MPRTLEERTRAAIDAPIGPSIARPDTRVIARPGWYQVVTPSAEGTALNEIVLSRVEEREAERIIDEAIATYAPTGHPVKWCVGPWTAPADFGERLERRGFRSWGVRGMGASVTLALDAPGDVSVEEVDPSRLDAYVDVMMRGWDVSPAQADAERAAHAAALEATPRLVHLFTARREGRCVGTAGLVLRDGYGYLTSSQVLEQARGRGVYRALVAARLAFLRGRGADYAVTHARDATSAPILERLGFETLFASRCYLLEADAARAALERLTPRGSS